MPEENPFLLIEGAFGGGKTDKPRTPIEEEEGVIGNFQAIDDEGNVVAGAERFVSLTQINTLDLLGEGECDGLVTGEYEFIGQEGKIGYSSAVFVPYEAKYIDGRNVNYLRSVYWNDTPVLSKENLFNFQQINVGFTPGLPNGSEVKLVSEANSPLTTSRTINERLRGPNIEITYGNQVKIIGEIDANAKTYRIRNRDVSSVNVNVRINALSETIIAGEKQGDTVKASLTYYIYYKPIFSSDITLSNESDDVEQSEYTFGAAETVNGKISYGYIRSTSIDLPETYLNIEDFAGWEIRIYRVTPDSIRGSLRNQTWVDSITEVYQHSFAYPNSFIVGQKFSAEYFSQIPSRSFDAKLLKVKVPSNYNTITRAYNGEWDGSFKTDESANENIQKEWTDNPAWCFYDIISNNRYGLGKYIDESLIDKWTLYEIAKYCDVLVPDGYGGLEPRFSCNLIINSREEAYRVINDMASIFRAITYYHGGSIFASQDSLKNDIFHFNNTNVENGDFKYSSSSKRVRHSVAIVRYNDKKDFYKPAIEYVEDVNAIKKYGIRELDLTAFGTTSRGQAIRYGKWALASESLETETVTFTAGIDASYLRPGDVFSIQDRYKHSNRLGGRTKQINMTSTTGEIWLDDEISLNSNSIYKLSLLSPDYNLDPTKTSLGDSSEIGLIRNSLIQKTYISGVMLRTESGVSKIGLNLFDPTYMVSPLNPSLNYSKNTVWSIEASGGDLGDIENQFQSEKYRAVRIKEEEDHKFTIAGVQYEESKYLEIESGLFFEDEESSVAPGPITQINFTNQAEVENATPTQDESNIKTINYQVLQTNKDSVSSYLVYAKNGAWIGSDFSERDGVFSNSTPDSKYLINILPAYKDTSNNPPEGSYIPLSNGTHYFRAYARNSLGVPSTNFRENVGDGEFTINVQGVNALKNIQISSLRLIQDTADQNLRDRGTGEYFTDEPTFAWQVGTLGSEPITTSQLKYRLTIRKSTDERSENPATINETPNFNDHYIPSTVIYYEKTGIQPTEGTDFTFTFEIEDSIKRWREFNSLNNQSLDPSGAFRDYDVVVEAHTDDGDSSAGGNISTPRAGTLINDSDFDNPNGYDITLIRNPRPPAIPLTPIADSATCLIGQGPCTDQWLSADGTVGFTFTKGGLPRDVEGGFFFISRENFDSTQALAGKNQNNITIYKKEFTSVNLPLISPSVLNGIENGYMAIAFYDSLDKKIRDLALVGNEDYDKMADTLNISNTVQLDFRGQPRRDQYGFRSWIHVEYEPSNDGFNYFRYSSIGIDRIEYEGLGPAVAGPGSESRFIRIFLNQEDFPPGLSFSLVFTSSKATFNSISTESMTIASTNNLDSSILIQVVRFNTSTVQQEFFIGVLNDDRQTKQNITIP